MEVENSIGLPVLSRKATADNVRKTKLEQTIDKYRTIKSDLSAQLLGMHMSTNKEWTTSIVRIVLFNRYSPSIVQLPLESEPRFLTDNRNHAMLLEMREEITAYLWAIASNTPMVTPIEYVSMNSLCSLVEKVEEELTKQRDAYNGNAPIFTNWSQWSHPDLLYQLVKDAKYVCEVSQSEFNLKATWRQLENI